MMVLTLTRWILSPSQLMRLAMLWVLSQTPAGVTPTRFLFGTSFAFVPAPRRAPSPRRNASCPSGAAVRSILPARLLLLRGLVLTSWDCLREDPMDSEGMEISQAIGRMTTLP